ncbi:MAG: Ribosome-binding factor A [Parcubacteria group bacterium Gr01-1014_29]|nr:MAG: Ribosome-binding factor A [Parcubacteria group bacterium Gr01-1014_29]
MERKDEKLTSIIRDEAATFIETHADIPPGVFLTATHVMLSPDHHFADVFISIYPTGRIGIFLNKFRTWQHAFNVYARETLRLKNIPAVRFKLDDTELKQERIENLLEGGGK